MAISPKFPKVCCEDRLEEVVGCEFRRAVLDGRVISLQSRIGLFEAHRNVRKTMSGIFLQFREDPLSRSREI
jgi:hypothetical protein